VAVDPAQAGTVNSVADRSFHGPLRPNHEMETSDVAPFRADSDGQSRPASGPRLSTTTSARATRSSSSARPSAVAQSIATLRFDVLRKRKRTPSSPGGSSTPHAVQRRMGSPPAGGSTLTTSAPASASSFVAYGP